MTMESNSQKAHDEVITLLPWYPNGTLTSGEMKTVEVHLAECEECRMDLKELREFRTAVGSAVDSRPAPSADLFSRVMARIRSYEAERSWARSFQPSWWERLSQWMFDLFPRRLAPAFALGIIVVQFVGLAVMSGVLYRTMTGQEYVTLTGLEVRETAGPAIRLRASFQEAAPERQIRSLLQKVEARITEGPSPEGFYIIEVPPKADVAKVLKTLNEEPAIVRYAERVER